MVLITKSLYEDDDDLAIRKKIYCEIKKEIENLKEKISEILKHKCHVKVEMDPGVDEYPITMEDVESMKIEYEK